MGRGEGGGATSLHDRADRYRHRRRVRTLGEGQQLRAPLRGGGADVPCGDLGVEDQLAVLGLGRHEVLVPVVEAPGGRSRSGGLSPLPCRKPPRVLYRVTKPEPPSGGPLLGRWYFTSCRPVYSLEKGVTLNLILICLGCKKNPELRRGAHYFEGVLDLGGDFIWGYLPSRDESR